MSALLLLSLPSLAATLSVGADGTYAGIQEAVDAASDGDTITVAAGTYAECVDLGGRDLSIVGTDGAASTLLSAGGSCDQALLLGAGETASITGLTIQNGDHRAVALTGATVDFVDVTITGSGNSTGEGGGVYMIGGDATFEDCTLSDNTGSLGGNLFLVRDATVTLSNSTVSGGTANIGGGIYVGYETDTPSALTIIDSTVSGNAATIWGAGLYLGEQTVLESEGSTYRDNSGATVNGGAIYASDGATLSSIDDSFVGNGSSEYDSGGTTTFGGAIYLEGYDTATLAGASFSGNFATRGGAICASGYTELSISDSSFDANEASTYGGAIQAASHTDVTLSDSTFNQNRSSDGVGGAIYVEDYGGLDIADTSFANNLAQSDGGAVAVDGHVPTTMSNVTFSLNTSEGGSGGALSASNYVALVLDGIEFTANQARENGGAAAFDTLIYEATLTDLEARNNSASNGHGGAYYASNSSAMVIEGGTFSLNRAGEDGGAVYVSNSDLRLADGSFEQNTAGACGGAIRVDNSEVATYGLTLTGGDFTQSRARTGGALCTEGLASLVVQTSTFDSSTTSDLGGALYLAGVDALDIRGNLFTFNHGSEGGAAYADGSDSSGARTWMNNLFVESDADSDGGALLLKNCDTDVFFNNTFVGNTALGEGGTLHLKKSTIRFNNNIVAYSQYAGGAYADDATSATSVFTYNDWYQNNGDDLRGFFDFDTTGLGNTSEDPGFVSATINGDYGDDDLSLADGSALIDGGDPSILDADGSISDIGASGGGTYEDLDADGYDRLLDCDDANAATWPDATEICDELDNDCDFSIDDEAEDLLTWCTDGDLDGYGSQEDRHCVEACTAPDDGYVSNAEDCDDELDTISPAAPELCDDEDNDCDGETDEVDAADATTWYPDLDEDGFGDAALGTVACDRPSDSVADGTDCDDEDEAIHPDAEEEVDDGVDQDCDGGETCYQNLDGDAYRSSEIVLSEDLDCGDAGEAASDLQRSDCDDRDPTINPAADDERGDGVDQDCDGADGVEGTSVRCSGCATSTTRREAWALLLGSLALVLRRRRLER